MSKQYPGGIISKTAPTPSGNYADSTAPGVWTLEQQAYWQKLGQWPTAGNVNPNAFIENLFSTYLYTGTGAALTITNGIDLSTNGGMVWCKARSNIESNFVGDTVRGANKALITNSNAAEDTNPRITAFNSNGFSLNSSGNSPNVSGYTYASWTFREQPKFFDVVTYTGDGVTGRTVAHNLGSTPGMIIVKGVDIVRNWSCYHQSLGATKYIELNSTGVPATDSTFWNDTAPTSTNFTVGGASQVNLAGYTYVAYIFAHDAGGFGLSGTDNVISCGSFTTDGSSNATVTLGYEPQWVLAKSTVGGPWYITDNMRGMSYTEGLFIQANSSAAEGSGGAYMRPTATGFGLFSFGPASEPYIYIAIRRGPMAVPTSGTSVFNTNIETTTTNPQTLTTGFPVDLAINTRRNSTTAKFFVDRLRGSSTTSINYLTSTNTNAETNLTGIGIGFDNNTGIVDSGWFDEVGAIYWNFRRAPSFFDEVCYTGTGANQTLPHNLGVVPELMITKNRSNSSNWRVYDAFNGPTKRGTLNADTAWDVQSTMWNDTAPTSTVFTVGTSNSASSQTYVIYLFATAAGVSKVGSYTGTGAAQTINCGFTGGSRFVLIKRTDSTGDWYVWDSARGIIPSNDPYLLLNTTAAEVTGTDYIDTTSVGFDITSTAPAAINANGGTFIFLAIA